jgi:hypothetical protein
MAYTAPPSTTTTRYSPIEDLHTTSPHLITNTDDKTSNTDTENDLHHLIKETGMVGPPGFLGGFPLNPGSPARQAGILPLDYGPVALSRRGIFLSFCLRGDRETLRRLVVRPPALRRRRARGLTVTSGSTPPQPLVPRQSAGASNHAECKRAGPTAPLVRQKL